MTYFLMPFAAWFFAGSLKYAINRIRFGAEANNLVGYGGFPSTHTTIVTTIVWYIGLTEGINNSIFGVALAMAFIVVIDSLSLRKNIGKHAKILNKLIDDDQKLREKMGHTPIEVLGGIFSGFLVSFIFYNLF